MMMANSTHVYIKDGFQINHKKRNTKRKKNPKKDGVAITFHLAFKFDKLTFAQRVEKSMDYKK